MVSGDISSFATLSYFILFSKTLFHTPKVFEKGLWGETFFKKFLPGKK
jgi:hypothetical protein